MQRWRRWRRRLMPGCRSGGRRAGIRVRRRGVSSVSAYWRGKSVSNASSLFWENRLTSLSLIILAGWTASHTLVRVLAPVRTGVAFQVGRSSSRRSRRRRWRGEESVAACRTRERRQRGRHGREDGTPGCGVGRRGRRGRGTGSWHRRARQRLELVSQSQVFLLQADGLVLQSG